MTEVATNEAPQFSDDQIIAEKKLQWIYGTTARWDGYLEFQRRPQPMLEWFEQYMS